MLSAFGNKKVKQKKDAFLKQVAQYKDHQWFVCSHDNPDPDSIASALAMQYILQFCGIERVDILYCGEISHPQNRSMCNILDIKLNKFVKSNDVHEDEDKSVYVFVDCMPGNKNMSINVNPVLVIDHHKQQLTNNGTDKNQLVIRDDIGSCSTLITELALSLPLTVSEDGQTASQECCLDIDDDRVRDVATALAIGIKSDTLDFRTEGTTEEDFKAYKLLSGISNEDKFNRIINYQFPPYMFDYEQIAWENKRTQFQPHLITGVGFIQESQSDCISYIADKFMRLEGVQTVVVFGIAGNSVRGSVRTSSASLDTQTLCNEIFGEGNGGARQGVGGARVSIPLFDTTDMSESDKVKLWELTKSQVEHKFEKAIGK